MTDEARELLEDMAKRRRLMETADKLFKKQQDVICRAAMYCANAISPGPHAMWGTIEQLEQNSKIRHATLDLQLEGLRQEMTAFRKSLSE